MTFNEEIMANAKQLKIIKIALQNKSDLSEIENPKKIDWDTYEIEGAIGFDNYHVEDLVGYLLHEKNAQFDLVNKKLVETFGIETTLKINQEIIKRANQNFTRTLEDCCFE